MGRHLTAVATVAGALIVSGTTLVTSGRAWGLALMGAGAGAVAAALAVV